MAKQYFWIGKGTIKHNGKIHDKKNPLPNNLPEAFLKAQIKLKNIGEKIEAAKPIIEDKKGAKK